MKPSRYHILLALASGPLHGAGIRRRVEEQSDGAVALYPAMLYGTLDELSGKGWIRELEEDPPEAETSRWRFYELCPAGREALEGETARLEAVVERAQASLRTAD